MDEERNKKLEFGKQKFAEFLKKKNDKKKRKRRTGSPICEMNELIINENLNPNHLINGSAISDDICCNNVHDMNDESISGDSNAIQLNETLKQRDALIKQLSERLQVTLQSRDDVMQTAESMALQVEELKNQLRLVSSSLLNKTVEDQPTLIDFECQTEWTEDSSIESMRRQSEYEISHDMIGVAVNTLSAVMEDKSEQTLQTHSFCENSVQTDNELLHQNCRQEVERTRSQLIQELTKRERQTELALLEQVNQLEEQMVRDRDTYLEESRKLDNQIDLLKSQICDLERKQRLSKSEERDFRDEEIQDFKNRINESSSLLQTYSPFHQNQSENESISTSRSPTNVYVQKYAAQTNSRLLHVLSDLVKTFLDTEHDIQKQLEKLGIETDGTNKDDILQGFLSLGEDAMERLSESNELCEDGPDLTPSSNLLYLTPPSTFMSNQSEIEVEDDVVLGASRRLRSAVDRILKLLGEIVAAHQEQDFDSVIKRNEELVTELNEECSRRDKLSAQLIQIEDRVKTLEKEKINLSEKVIDYNEVKRQMETMKVKIDEYEAERDKWVNDNKRLEKEKCTFAQGLPQLQQISNNSTAQIVLYSNTSTELVNDNEVLNSDVRQLQQERIKLLQRIHALTLESEHLRSERDDILDEKRKECEDFVAQIESNEKNLLSYRKFIDEQTHERESERDEFNKELMALIERLKDKDKSEAKLRSRLEELETQITCLTEEKYFKDKQINDLNSHLKCANHEISELRGVIVHMEKENEKCNHTEKQLRNKVNDLNEALDLQIKIHEESQQDVLTTSLLERITFKTHQLQNTLGSPECESESEDVSIECSYNDIRLLSEKLNALNDCIDKLLIQNNSLKSDLDRAKNESHKDYQELIKEKDSLDRNLMEIMRSNEILQEELNSKHLQLSALKSRLESSLESSDMKYMIEELQTKLINEEHKSNELEFEITSLKQQIDDNNNKTLQINEKLNVSNDYIQKLVVQNNNLKSELDQVRSDNHNDYQELIKEKEGLDRDLMEIMRKNEVLHEELNDKQLQLIELKSIQERAHQSNDMKHMIEELQTKLKSEEYKSNGLEREISALQHQIDDNNNKTAQLNHKLNSLNEYNEKLLIQNNSLKSDLDRMKNESHRSYQEFVKEKDSLNRNLIEIMRSNEMLQNKLDNKHLQLNELKSKLKASLESSVKRHNIEELQTKLIAEEHKSNELEYEITSLKQQIYENNNKTLHINEKLNVSNDFIQKLVVQNNNLKSELDRVISDNKDLVKQNDKINAGKSQQLNSEKFVDEDEKLQGINNHFLWKLKRVVSHKNALIYQKKYLLHVLGGFQLTERATLALLANMNVTVDDESPAFQSGRNKFRSIVFSIIAISRMKSLVRNWKHRNHHKNKPTVAKAVSTHSLGANNESQTDSTLQEFVNRLQRLHDTLGLRNGQI